MNLLTAFRDIVLSVACFHQEPTPFIATWYVTYPIPTLSLPKIVTHIYYLVVEGSVAAHFCVCYQTVIHIVLTSRNWLRSLGKITRLPRLTRDVWFCLTSLWKLYFLVQANKRNSYKKRETVLDRIGLLSWTCLVGYQAPSQHDVGLVTSHPSFQVPIRCV